MIQHYNNERIQRVNQQVNDELAKKFPQPLRPVPPHQAAGSDTSQPPLASPSPLIRGRNRGGQSNASTNIGQKRVEDAEKNGIKIGQKWMEGMNNVRIISSEENNTITTPRIKEVLNTKNGKTDVVVEYNPQYEKRLEKKLEEDDDNFSFQRLSDKQKSDMFMEETKNSPKYQIQGRGKYGVANPNEKDITAEKAFSQSTIDKKGKIVSIRDLVKKYNIPVEIVEKIVTPEGKKAYGVFINQTKGIELSKMIKESTFPHELLHAVFDMADVDTKKFLLKSIMEEENISAEQAEEKLADMFSNYFLTGKIGKAPKSTWGKIKKFFDKVKRLLKGLYYNDRAIRQFFDDVIAGEVDSSPAGLRGKNDGKKTGFSDENEYTSYQENGSEGSSNTSVGKSPATIFVGIFKKDANGVDYIEDINGNITRHIAKNRDQKKWEYKTTSPLPLSKNSQRYITPLKDILSDTVEQDTIGRIPGEAVPKDPRERPMIFSFEKFKKIFQKHGQFSPENLLETINNPTFAFRNVRNETTQSYDEDKINILKRIPGSNNFWVVGAERNNGFFFLTNVEVRRSSEQGIDERIDERVQKQEDIFVDNRTNSQYQSAGDIYSDNFKKRFGDWETDPKNASKVVNEDGTPKIMYHGTPNGGYTIFNDNSHFTENKTYADHYQEQNASSIVYKKTQKNPKTYEVYLNIKKPFDTRNTRAKNIFENEYQAYYSPELTDKGMVDWMEARDLADRLKENHPEYDGLIVDEQNLKGEDRGIAYVPFSPNQIKSATDNVGTYDSANPDIRFQESDEIEEGERIFRETEKQESEEMGEYDPSIFEEEKSNKNNDLPRVVRFKKGTAKIVVDEAVEPEKYEKLMKKYEGRSDVITEDITEQYRDYQAQKEAKKAQTEKEKKENIAKAKEAKKTEYRKNAKLKALKVLYQNDMLNYPYVTPEVIWSRMGLNETDIQKVEGKIPINYPPTSGKKRRGRAALQDFEDMVKSMAKEIVSSVSALNTSNKKLQQEQNKNEQEEIGNIDVDELITESGFSEKNEYTSPVKRATTGVEYRNVPLGSSFFAKKVGCIIFST